jgi:hypothetical protein
MELPDKDILISRVVDDEATGEDWAALRELAERDPTIWRDLAQAQYTSIGLASAVEAAIEIADRVEPPVHEHMRAGLRFRAGAAAKWWGWLAAAAVTLAWAGAGMPARTGVSGASLDGAVPTAGSAADAFRQYLDVGKRSGQVVQEVPQLVLVETKPAPDGAGYEVFYIRQVIERAVVQELYGLGQDEAGRPARINLQPRPEPAEPM